MCAICGKLQYANEARVDAALIQRMTDAMAHRGPDGQGQYVSGPVGLGHRRLSIIDLSTGAQPLANEDETVWIVFNGEIYNYQDLRASLLSQGHRFKTASDTEVIVHLYEEYGTGCLDRLRGMFAFAIWDANQRRLFVARDRVGIKPLYYCDTGKSFVFASEIKALLLDPEVKREVNLPAVDCFLTHLFLPGEQTLFKNIKKLEPGRYALIDAKTSSINRPYWDLEFRPTAEHKTLDDAAAALSEMLSEAVRLHMISDVPVGILLSGGVDSTGVLSYAAKLTDKEIQTFTVGFEGEQFADERPYARLAAKRFGTRHYDITMTAEDFRDFLPRYVWHMEEPVCEPPAIALYYVSKLARQHVTVLLSGEGGDEAFGGYSNYRNLLMLEALKAGLGPFCGVAGGALAAAGSLTGSGRAAKYAPLLTTPLADYYFSRTASPFSFFNRSKRSLYTEDFSAQLDSGAEPAEVIRKLFGRVAGKDLLSQMLYIDTKTWLPDDLLIKADKMTMANSLELRVPLLDHKLLEFAATLPPAFKVHRLSTKRVLKRAFNGGIPREIIERKKTGFPVPYGRWLSRELAGYVSDTLTSGRAVSRGLLKPQAVAALLEESSANGRLTKEVFSLLVLELWHQQFADAIPEPGIPACGSHGIRNSL